MLVASLRVHKTMTFTFATLFVGFILLVLEHFYFPELKKLAAIDLIICAFAAWYMMAGIIINDLAGKTVLPMGKKFIN
jgi:succinate-acetate transporter protein